VRLHDFDFELPADRIAQVPAPSRDASRLMLLERATGAVRHHRFRDLVRLLHPGDLLVLNDSRVVPARLVGHKASGGRVELLRIEPIEGTRSDWRCLLRASRPPGPGSRLRFEHGLAAEVLEHDGDHWILRFHAPAGAVEELLDRVGRVPLPPYIRREGSLPTAEDRVRYQTVYARRPGSIAAPTAGLHFTPELLEALAARGVRTATLTLHVGPATFQPVRTVEIERHRLAGERCEIPDAAAREVAAARRRSGRVVAVGTTVVRALEGRATEDGSVSAGAGECTLFIRPGHRFRVVDALVTNFHLPRSTLLMLVCAFAGREPVLAAYAAAVRDEYRFYSYGDAMLVL